MRILFLKNNVVCMNTDKLKFRDFIYLDVERMKSIFSQIYEGISESSTEEKGGHKTVSAEGEGSGSIPLVAKIKGGIKGEIIWENRETETKTLHDHMYNMVEDELKERNSVYFIDKNEIDIKKSWLKGDLGKISDTSFLLIKGRVMIDDYENFQKVVRDFNKIQEALSSFHVELPADPEERKLFKHIFKRTLQEQGTYFDDEMIDNILFLLKHFYQNELFIKALPYPDNYYLRFIGNLNREFLRDSMESITFKYGTFPVSEWYVFGQVSSIFPKGYEPMSFIKDTKYEKIFQNAGKINTILTNLNNAEITVKNNYDLDHIAISSLTNVSQEDIEFLKSLHLDTDDYNVLQSIGMDIVLESVFNGFRGVEHVFSTKFPSVTFTPIAIYRGD